MGGGGRDRREEERLAAERAAQAAAANTAIATASQPTELEKFLNDEDLNILRYFSGQGSEPIDIRNAPGMRTPNALYDSAIKDQDSEMMGIGALRLGADDNAGYTNLLRENQRERKQRDAAGRLESAVNQRVATARGEAMPLINISNDRSMGIAGLRSGMYEGAAGREFQFRNRPRQPSFWKQLLLSGAQGAGAVGAASMGISDGRLKENIRPLNDLVNRLSQLRGVSFTWSLKAAALGLNPGQLDAGVLAQDVERVFPELVTVADDGYRRVNYTALTGMLVEAMKALESENAELRARATI